MILADDEKQDFKENYIEKLKEDLEPVENPDFSMIIGAKGSGKTTLAKKMHNYMLISPDAIIAKYAELVGEDIREDFYDKELGLFATEIVNQAIKEAIKNRYNILYESTEPKNMERLMFLMPEHGYSVSVKAVVVDEYFAALNAEERNLTTKQRIDQYRQRKSAYPDVNPLKVTAESSMLSSLKVMQTLERLDSSDIDLEVYEFGRVTPSYIKGLSHKNIHEFFAHVELPPMKENILRAEKLKKLAKENNDEDAFLRISALQAEMKRS